MIFLEKVGGVRRAYERMQNFALLTFVKKSARKKSLPFMTVTGEIGSDVGELSGVFNLLLFFHGEVSGVGCSLTNIIA